MIGESFREIAAALSSLILPIYVGLPMLHSGGLNRICKSIEIVNDLQC